MRYIVSLGVLFFLSIPAKASESNDAKDKINVTGASLPINPDFIRTDLSKPLIALPDDIFIMSHSREAKSANSHVENLRSVYETEISRREHEIDAESKVLYGPSLLLDPSALKKRQREFEEKVWELQKFILSGQNELRIAEEIAMGK